MSSSEGNVAISAVSAVNHIALMTADLDRLVGFYQQVFGAEVLARGEGQPRKCFLKVAAATNLHVFERPRARATSTENPFDEGSINHFALQASDPEAFTTIRSKLILDGHAAETVYDAPGLYTLFATDPDGLLAEVLVPKETGWTPSFATEPFVGLGEPATRSALGGEPQ